MKPSILAIAFLILSISMVTIKARDDENDQGNIDDKCNSPATPDQYECADNQWKIEDKELNNQYKLLRQKLERGSSAEKKLIDAQKAWITFRDADCEFEGDGFAGYRRGVMITTCLKDRTAKRNQELRGYLNEYNH